MSTSNPIAQLVIEPKPHHKRWGAAMKEGLEKHGVRCVVTDRVDPFTEDFVVCWSWRLGCKVKDRPILVMENGFLGDRSQRFSSCGWDGLNGRAVFPHLQAVMGSDRRQRLLSNVQLMDWDTSSKGNFLILGQVPGDANLEGMDITQWYRMIATQWKQVYPGRVVFRPHPLSHSRLMLPGVPCSSVSLEEDLQRCFAGVTFNSNSAVDMILAGKPCIIADEGSMAWSMRSTSIRTSYPDRSLWFDRLSWCQWEEEEYRDGTVWEHMRHYLDGGCWTPGI